MIAIFCVRNVTNFTQIENDELIIARIDCCKICMKKLVVFCSQIIVLIWTISSIMIAQTWTQVGNDIDGEAAYDESGFSVALSSDGKRMAHGAIKNDGIGIDAGHVRVYSESSGIWTQVGSDIDGEAPGDESGSSVSLSSDGMRLAIGAIRNNNGHVRVYSDSSGIWTQVGSDIDGAFGFFGNSVSLSSDGRRVAIGAWRGDGYVRVYSDSSGIWKQVGSDIDGEGAGDQSGRSVSLSSDGNRIAIGAKLNDDTAIDAGHVRVYSDSSGIWKQVGSDIDGEAAYDHFGWSVSLSSDGNRVAIGGFLNDGIGIDAGHVQVYSDSSGIWKQVGSDIDGETAGDHLGVSVSLSSDGKLVAIGAYENDGSGNNAGHVRVYSESGGLWTQVGNDIDGEAAGDRSGWSVSLSRDVKRVAIGSEWNDGSGIDAGHVRVYATDALNITDNEIFYSLPNKLTLLPVYPNPFNPTTTITYGLDKDSDVSINIYDISGKQITTLQNKYQTQGWHSIIWYGFDDSGTKVGGGVYFCQVKVGDLVETEKMVLVK